MTTVRECSFLDIVQWNDSTKRESVRISDDNLINAVDLVMSMAGKNRNVANEVLRDLKPSHFNKEKFITRSRGRWVTFKDALQLIMVIGGDEAKETRKQFAETLTRFFAADQSLIADIESNANSTSPIVQLARASLATVPVQDELSLARKRKLEELEIARLETEVEAGKLANRSTELANHTTELTNRTMELTNRTMELTNIAMARDSAREHLTIIRDSAREHLTKITASYRELCQDTVIDERARLMLKDNFLNMAMVQADSGGAGQALITNGQASVPQNKPISLSMIATELGLRIPSNDLISIGVELKKRYCQLHGKEPSKHDQLCNGRMTKVNTYMESDRSLVDEVLRWYAANRD